MGVHVRPEHFTQPPMTGLQSQRKTKNTLWTTLPLEGDECAEFVWLAIRLWPWTHLMCLREAVVMSLLSFYYNSVRLMTASAVSPDRSKWRRFLRPKMCRWTGDAIWVLVCLTLVYNVILSIWTRAKKYIELTLPLAAKRASLALKMEKRELSQNTYFS